MTDIRSTRAPAFMWRLLTSAAICSLMVFGGCSDDGEQDDTGKPCSSPQDCGADLVCQDGNCVAPDNNGGADGGDVGHDGDGGTSNNQVGPEDYVISYAVRDRNTDETTLWAYVTSDGSRTQVTDDPALCAANCWLNDDLDALIYTESVGQGIFDVIKAPVVDLEVQSDRTTIAEGVSDVRVVGNLVTYRREDNGTYHAFYLSIADGSEEEMGNLGSGSTTIGGWHIDPNSNRQAIFLPYTQELQLRFDEMGGSSSDTYTYDAQNYQQVSGSYFSSSMPMAFSPDGRLAAFVTEAPNDYGTCGNASECSGPIKRCGQHDRCTAIEVTVHFVDLDDIGSLGTQCDGAGSCGDIHRCYQPDGTADTSECAPGRVVLGIPEFPAQSPEPGATATGGCELSDGHADYPYTKFNGPISFDADGRLYGVALRDCAGSDAGQSHILRVDPTTKDYEVVWGNEDGGYDGDLCWDSDALEPDDTECQPYITRAHLSPQYNELAMLATNPWVGDPARASANMDVWTVRRDGDSHSWVGGNEQLESVPRFSVHPAP